MSRKGKMPIPLPKGVEVKLNSQNVSVKGPKGTLHKEIMKHIQLDVEDGQILVSIQEGSSLDSKFHGLWRVLVANMVKGVTEGFHKELELQGVGYRASVQGHHVDLQLGYSHPVKLPIPEGVTVKIEKGVNIVIAGPDKQIVGQFAADIRAIRPPEVYQGKGVRYKGEYVRRKAGKAGKAK